MPPKHIKKLGFCVEVSSHQEKRGSRCASFFSKKRVRISSPCVEIPFPRGDRAPHIFENWETPHYQPSAVWFYNTYKGPFINYIGLMGWCRGGRKFWSPKTPDGEKFWKVLSKLPSWKKWPKNGSPKNFGCGEATTGLNFLNKIRRPADFGCPTPILVPPPKNIFNDRSLKSTRGHFDPP